MIVSHRHRFIFLKTAKTAGSSIEAALLPFLGPDDIVGGDSPKPWRRARRFDGRNHLLGLSRAGVYVPRSLARLAPQLTGFYPHMPARQVRALVGEDIWSAYYKFSIERNPWDRQLSQYFYRHRKRRGETLSFERYLTSPWYRAVNSVFMDNWGIYAAGDSVAVDRVFRFENLQADFSEICARFGMEGAVLPHINDGPKRDRPYRDYYSDRTRDMIAGWYRREIKTFGYEF